MTRAWLRRLILISLQRLQPLDLESRCTTDMTSTRARLCGRRCPFGFLHDAPHLDATNDAGVRCCLTGKTLAPAVRDRASLLRYSVADMAGADAADVQPLLAVQA